MDKKLNKLVGKKSNLPLDKSSTSTQSIDEMKTVIEDMVKIEFKKYDLTQNGWTFVWGNAIRTGGCCYLRRKLIRMSQVVLKREGLEMGKDTLLHEIAHALSPKDEGHGKEWKAMCLVVGAKPERCYKITPYQYKFSGTYPLCDCTESANRRTVFSCACDGSGVFNPKNQIIWTRINE